MQGPMHLTILPELRVVASSLPVYDSCNLGAVDENVVGKGVAVSEMDLCVRRELTYSGPRISRNIPR